MSSSATTAGCSASDRREPPRLPWLSLSPAWSEGACALGRPSEATSASMRMLAGTGTISSEKETRALGWTPSVDLDEGMARTEGWLRKAGYLDG